jgi:MYXO-CTERM domain-containing protein
MTERNRRPQDPSLVDPTGIDEPHDVLAAEEFGIGTRDDRLPPDPTGIQEPHDILAAEEFAMPAGAEPHSNGHASRSASWVPLLALGAIAALVLARRRR